MHFQTIEFDRMLRDFEQFYALTARDGGTDWAAYEAPANPLCDALQERAS